MNLCILLGVIISDIEFKFIVEGKNKSIAYFDMLLLNKSIVKVRAYNEKADYIYKNFKINQSVIIEGKIRDNGIIEYRYSFKYMS